MNSLHELLAVDPAGFPVLLAKEQPAPEPVMGLHAPPEGVDPGEWLRRQDAVRSAAREFESFKDQDAREWLKGMTKRDLTDKEISSFVADVKAHVITDIVDVLDQAQRGVLRGRRTVRVVAPRGYVRKTLKALSSEDLDAVRDRLLARGWTKEQVDARLPEKSGL